jgi:hypothetical protein
MFGTFEHLKLEFVSDFDIRISDLSHVRKRNGFQKRITDRV